MGGYPFAHPVIPTQFLCTVFLSANLVSKSHQTSFSRLSGRFDLDLAEKAMGVIISPTKDNRDSNFVSVKLVLGGNLPLG